MRKRYKGNENFVPRDARGKNVEKSTSQCSYLPEDEARPAFQGERRRRRGPLFFPIKGIAEKSVAHATAERLRESQCLAFYGGEDARATPPRRAPREESHAFSRTR